MPDCCPPKSWPAQSHNSYVPKGHDEKLGDLPLYVSGAPSTKGVLVYPEVFGFSSNLKQICDLLAAAGFFVVMVDNFRGECLPEEGGLAAFTATNPSLVPPRKGLKVRVADFLGTYVPMICAPCLGEVFSIIKTAGAFMKRFPYDTVIGPDTEKVLKWMASKGCTSVGAMGFCWGVWALCKASAAGLPLKCGVGPHPSTHMEYFISGTAENQMLERVKMPVLILPAGNDPPVIKPGGEVAAILERSGGRSVPFPDMTHGWMGRGDLSLPVVKRDFDEGMRLALEHFKRHL